MKVLMVCLGNICRSPMAEGILKDKVKEQGLNWQVDSCGTASYHIGEGADARAQEIMRIKDHDITTHRAQQLTREMLDEYDLIYCMDKSNYEDVLELASPAQAEKVSLILEMLPDSEHREVPDPYYNNKFYLVYNLLNEATDLIVKRYK